MSLPESEWLALAKGVAKGGKARHKHHREGRNNLIVGNEGDRWWAYCQSCKEGGVVHKEHVRLTDVAAPKESESLVLPHDLVPVLCGEKAVQDGVAGFLASKNMDAMYLPPMHFSASRKRLMLSTGQGWLGRDTTGRSPQKWLTFTAGTRYLGYPGAAKDVAAVVEDPFSYFKVGWALAGLATDTFCSLGTAVHDKLVLELMGYRKVIMFYDGDAAGEKGAMKESMRFRAFGLKSIAACAPNGMDPKDMTIAQIREHVLSIR